MFKQAFSHQFGDDILTWKRIGNLHKLACCQDASCENLKLIDLVNLTDFMGMSDCCSLFEIDSLKHC